MRILLLGGTGAIGGFLVQILAAQRNEVHVTSRSNYESDIEGVYYIHGNAREDGFLNKILKSSYDVIVDFMIYNDDEFKKRLKILLMATKQYIFLSSSRVYADSKNQITEKSLRLLDACNDKEYLATNEYALSKAHQEDALINSGYKNWTIIRPYITYSDERLQLGVYEKEQWLYRALHGRTIVFSKDIASRMTTLTSGYDVATGMAKLIGNKKALGETLHIVAQQTMTWKEVLNIYLDVIEKKLNQRPKVYFIEEMNAIQEIMCNKYQVKYDRFYNRSFNSEKANEICGYKIEYAPMREGLEKCLQNFLESERKFGYISWKCEAYMDKLTGERVSLNEILSWKDKLKYLVWRYTPYFTIKY